MSVLDILISAKGSEWKQVPAETFVHCCHRSQAMQPDVSPPTGPPAIKGESPHGTAVCSSDCTKDDVDSETDTACSSSTGDSPPLDHREVSADETERQATCAEQPMLGSGRGSADIYRFGVVKHFAQQWMLRSESGTFWGVFRHYLLPHSLQSLLMLHSLPAQPVCR